MQESSEGIDALTPRQKEILRLIAQHLQAKEIARALNISEHTVKTHTEIARRRLGVGSSREAARLLVAHETALGIVPEFAFPIPLGGGYVKMGMPETAESPVNASDQPQRGDHGQDISSGRELSDAALARSGIGLADAGDAVEADADRRRASDGAQARQDGGAREGGLHSGGGHGLADRRRSGFRERLQGLNSLQWLILILLTAIVMPILLGGLLGGVLSTLRAIEELSRTVVK